MKIIYILADDQVLKTHAHYEAAIQAAGGTPRMCRLDLPADAQLSDADGILIPGGVDLNPALYHEGNTASININDTLDSFQMEAVDYAVRHRLPVLGICRGQQVLNVYFGGSLIQNVPHAARHAYDLVRSEDQVHPVLAEKNSFAFECYGREYFRVNSAHHQAVDRPGRGLKAVMTSEDGLVEGMVHQELPIMSVQWHPERMSLACRRKDTEDGMPVFRYFMEHLVEKAEKD